MLIMMMMMLIMMTLIMITFDKRANKSSGLEETVVVAISLLLLSLLCVLTGYLDAPLYDNTTKHCTNTSTITSTKTRDDIDNKLLNY